MRRGYGWWFKGEPMPGIEGLHIDLGLDEAADTPAKDTSAASESSQGGSEDAAALTDKPNHQ
jgi:hypothetical protein